jgi:outer membrane protein assembly factor BamE (lipoprotein component of BamABCDE complex)
MFIRFLILISFTLLAGCSTNSGPLVSIPSRSMETQRLAVGAAQMLKVGSTSERVIELLGSPNVVTNNEDGLETWVYDKVSKETEVVRTSDGGWLFTPKQQQSVVSVVGERTLIVVIKFDKGQRVSNVRYRQTSY